MSDAAPSRDELYDTGSRLLAAGLKPLTWHPQAKDGSWAKIPDLGRDEKKGWAFHAAADNDELIALVDYHDQHWHGTGGIGVLLGAPSSALVLEADPRNGGAESFARLSRDAGWDPNRAITNREHVCWRSGRGDGGGGFLFARQSDEARTLRTLAARYPGVDVLDEGRFQALPPSLHPDSLMRYAWRVWPGPELLPQMPPHGLVNLAKSLSDEARVHWQAATGSTELPAIIGQGERDTLLTSFAGSMRRRGASEEEIIQMLGVMNARCSPPHSSDDIRRIARSVAKYAPGEDPALDQKLVAWAASQAQKDEEQASLIPSLAEMMQSPEGVQALKRAVLSERARIEIRAAKAAQEFKPPPFEAVQPLDVRLSYPRQEVPHLIEPMWRARHRIVLAALYKTGKSLLAANAVGSLATGTPFLGFAPVKVPPRTVAWWNLEMDGNDADDYLAGCVPPGEARSRVRMAALREHPVPFLRSDPAMRLAIETISGCKTWVIDTWTRLCAWNGVDVSDNAGSSELASAIDQLCAAAGVEDLMILSHMPKSARAESTAESPLGAQALAGWADCLWLYWVNNQGERFLRAEGRGVSVDEFRVEIASQDPGDKRLTAIAGGRHEAEDEDAVNKVLAALRASAMAGNTGVGANSLVTLTHLGRQKVQVAVKYLLNNGQVVNVGTTTKPDLRLAGPASAVNP